MTDESLPSASPGQPLPQRPADKPVFNCIVLLARRDGRVAARVANLAGLEAEGNSERDALQRIVALFKSHLAAQHAAGQPIEWREPPEPPQPGEQQRLIAVHL